MVQLFIFCGKLFRLFVWKFVDFFSTFALHPLADKYPSVSPYAYCNSNPVNFVDPDGKDIYWISSNGQISLLEETKDAYDILQAENSVYYVADQSILSQLANIDQEGVRKAVSSSSESIELFYFLSDYTSVQ